MAEPTTSQPTSATTVPSSDKPLTLDSILSEAAAVELKPLTKGGDKNADDKTDPEGQEQTEPQTEQTTETEEEPKGEHEEQATEETETEQGPEKKPDGTRDYSKFDKEDQPFLKQMSKGAFEHFSKRLMAVKDELTTRDTKIAEMQKVVDEVEGKRLPDNWYNDPEAGKLSPAYKEAKKGFEEWQAKTHQLGDMIEAVEAGELVLEGDKLVPYVAKGEDDDGPAIDRRLVRRLTDMRQEAFEKQKEFAEKGNTIERNFGQSYQQAEATVAAGIDKFFPWTKDEKHANQAALKSIMNEWPEPHRKHPVTKFASALAVDHIVLQRKYSQLQQELAAAKNLKTARRNGGPIPGRGSARATTEEDKPMKLSDFET